METTTTLRGTCQICFREMNVDADGMIHRHGWRELGHRQLGQYGNATQHGECQGVGKLPFEYSCEDTKAYIVDIFYYCMTVENWLSRNQSESESKIQLAVMKLTNTKMDGLEYVQRVNDWKKSDLTVVSRAQVVHAHRVTRSDRYSRCGARGYGLRISDDKDEVTCTKCLASIEASEQDALRRQQEAEDKKALVTFLTQNGPSLPKAIKAGLGWDIKRFNKACNFNDDIRQDYSTKKYALR